MHPCVLKILLTILHLYELSQLILLKWDPPTLDQVSSEKLDIVFQPFKEELELQIPEKEECRSA